MTYPSLPPGTPPSAPPGTQPPTRRTLRATFVMEQHLGHQTFSDNLRRCVERHADVDARWVEVTYTREEALWERLPGVGARVQGALRGRAQARRGCGGAAADVRFFNTQVPAVLGGRHVRTSPYVLCTDVTPVQYDRMAAHYGHAPDGDGPVARYKHRLNTAAFREAAHNVVWSRWVRDSLVHDYGVDPACIDVIPPGVDTATWSGGAGTTGRAGHPVRLLFVGGDFHRKGGRDLLHAFRSLPPGSAELVLVTRTKVDAGPDVRVATDLTPNSPELRTLFRSSDVFVLPSSGETFGIAAVEAAASGLPVIATRVGGFSDIVADGETGFLVEPGDVSALTSRLTRLVEDAHVRRRMGAAARRRVEERFEAHRNAGRILDILRSVAGPGSRPGTRTGASPSGESSILARTEPIH